MEYVMRVTESQSFYVYHIHTKLLSLPLPLAVFISAISHRLHSRQKLNLSLKSTKMPWQ